MPTGFTFRTNGCELRPNKTASTVFAVGVLWAIVRDFRVRMSGYFLKSQFTKYFLHKLSHVG